MGASAGEVVLCTTLGRLSEFVDHGDGTYTATLRADSAKETSSEVDAAVVVIPVNNTVVTGTLNGVVIPDSAVVELRLEADGLGVQYPSGERGTR